MAHLSGGGLAKAAKQYFGLNQEWNIGITGVSGNYFIAPAAPAAGTGPGGVRRGPADRDPLGMASVAATVSSGLFKQPILVPGTRQVTATPLPTSTQSQLRELMRAVVTSGTAAPIGFGLDVYAKTGTAQIQGQEQPNSWIIAFDPTKDVAIACLVVNAGDGASSRSRGQGLPRPARPARAATATKSQTAVSAGLLSAPGWWARQ